MIGAIAVDLDGGTAVKPIREGKYALRFPGDAGWRGVVELQRRSRIRACLARVAGG